MGLCWYIKSPKFIPLYIYIVVYALNSPCLLTDFSESININELQDKSTEYSKEESLILKREKRRNKIICEILDTEETYHRHLNLVTEVWLYITVAIYVI